MGNSSHGVRDSSPRSQALSSTKTPETPRTSRAKIKKAGTYDGPKKTDELVFGAGVGTLTVETWEGYRLGASLWPSGMLLARAFATGASGMPCVVGRHVAELGAGIGLPSLVCGRLGAAEVTITDRIDLVPLIERNIELNSLSSNCRAVALDWASAANSPLATRARHRKGRKPLDVVLAADVVYFEEQEPLIDALLALMEPGYTELVLAYRQRTTADRVYLEETILPDMEITRIDYAHDDHDVCEIYVGKRKFPNVTHDHLSKFVKNAGVASSEDAHSCKSSVFSALRPLGA